jgi:hypothetical protein
MKKIEAHCHRCGVTLTDEEKYFYSITCEDCECKWLSRIEAWRRGAPDAEFDEQFRNKEH